MTVSEILQSKRRTTSFEVFPPKNDAPFAPVQRAVDALASFRPDFMSVTYRAEGGTSRNTPAIAAHIEKDLHISALAHLTCASLPKTEMTKILRELKDLGVRNVLALRGDLPEGYDAEDATRYVHASGLIRKIRRTGGFCVGAACYPEGHPEAGSLERDIEYLKEKADSGADFFITQMFFDNSVLYSFLYRILKAGIHVPVLAGVMPVTNVRQILRSCALAQTSLPTRFRRIIDRFSDNPEALRQAGIAYATEQIIDLLANGVDGVHIYTMNRPEVAGQIMLNLSSIL